MPAPSPLPDAALAAELAATATGRAAVEVRRFGTGTQHYVFKALFADRPPVVVRIAASGDGATLAGAVRLSALLRPTGVPLPEILADGSDHRHPHLVLERLPGVDLGDAIGGLSDSALEAIARKVVDAQRLAGATRTTGRYGYAVVPEAAPWARWSEVIADNLARSRRRIAAAALFDMGAVERVAARITALRARLDAQPAIPFLHDTTTKNVIVTRDGAFSGIVDVDDLCFGDPRYAAALTLASLLVSGGPTRYVEEWMRLAGRADDATFRLYVCVFLVDFMSEHSQTFNGNAAGSTDAKRRRLLQTFDAQLRRLA